MQNDRQEGDMGSVLQTRSPGAEEDVSERKNIDRAVKEGSGADLKTCSKCGETKPTSSYYSNCGRCVSCVRDYGRAYRAANADKVKQRKKKWYESNKDALREYCRKWRSENAESVKSYQKEYQRANKDALREKLRARNSGVKYYERNGRKFHYRGKYGITIANYEAMLEKQNGQCAICGTDSPGKNKRHFHVDHDHLSGKVRGLLCGKCNMGIGSFDDSTSLLIQAYLYVSFHRADGNPLDYEG